MTEQEQDALMARVCLGYEFIRFDDNTILLWPSKDERHVLKYGGGIIAAPEIVTEDMLVDLPDFSDANTLAKVEDWLLRTGSFYAQEIRHHDRVHIAVKMSVPGSYPHEVYGHDKTLQIARLAACRAAVAWIVSECGEDVEAARRWGL